MTVVMAVVVVVIMTVIVVVMFRFRQSRYHSQHGLLHVARSGCGWSRRGLGRRIRLGLVCSGRGRRLVWDIGKISAVVFAAVIQVVVYPLVLLLLKCRFFHLCC